MGPLFRFESGPYETYSEFWNGTGGLKNAVPQAMERQLVQARITAGDHDRNSLTDYIFWRRHPELRGMRIGTGQRDLVNEWMAILRDIVLPVLSAAGSGVTPTPAAGDSQVTAVLHMAARQVPGLGITLRELLEQHRAQQSPEIPIEVLLAFIYFEAGHLLFDDATAGKWNNSSQSYSPAFFELGIFQTPAGEHGCRNVNGTKVCAFRPPGNNIAGSQFGKGWHYFTGTYPTERNWNDPVMQVRIGLWDLATTGDRIRDEYPGLFPNKQSEWYVRMAVLFSFAVGAGWTRAFLNRYGAYLLQLPEDRRWDFLRSKYAALPGRSGQSVFMSGNVDKKMALAAKVHALGPMGSSVTPPRVPTTPPTSVPAAGLGDPLAHEYTPGAYAREGEFEIFGTDDRVLITDTTAIPFRFICCLDLVFANPTDPTSSFLLRGSGTLISDRHVLTAAHNVLGDMTRLGAPGIRAMAARIFAAPGRNGTNFPFGRSEAINMRVTPQWQTSANAEFDFALLTLHDPLGATNQTALGNRPLGFWSHPQLGGGTRIRPLEIKVLRNMPVNLSGYPSDKCLDQPPDRPATPAELAACTGGLTNIGSTQWRSFGNVVDPAPATEPRSITYDLDDATGHSGGPIWLRWQDFRNLVAVNTGGFPRPTAPFDIVANMGVRITDDVLRQIREWMKIDGVSATF